MCPVEPGAGQQPDRAAAQPGVHPVAVELDFMEPLRPIGAGLRPPSRACWRACWSMLGGERLTPSHAIKKGRRYRYYVSAAPITDAGTDRAQGWRLAAREIEEAVIRILSDALTSPAGLVEPFGAASMPDHIPKLLNRAARLAAALGGSPDKRAKLVRELVEKISG